MEIKKSGAHLAGMVVSTDWARHYGLTRSAVHAAVVVGGLYDVKPVRLSYRNEMLKLDRSSEIRNSPCRNLPDSGPPLLVAYGENETTEFRRQALEYAKLRHRRHENCELLEVAGRNHYETIEPLTILGAYYRGRYLAGWNLTRAN